jgi:hypothetical protein
LEKFDLDGHNLGTVFHREKYLKVFCWAGNKLTYWPIFTLARVTCPRSRHAMIVRSRAISNLSTFEIGQPAFAAAAASSTFALSAAGALTVVWSILLDKVKFSKVIVQLVSTDSGVMPRSPSWALRAMLKQLA